MDCRLGITFNLPTIINQYWLDYKQLYLGPAAFSTTLVVEEPRGIYRYITPPPPYNMEEG